MGPGRDAVLEGLRRVRPADAKEAADLARIVAFVQMHDRPFDRGIAQGHLTASALVVSAAGDRALLLHHRKLGIWVQPGGHADPDDATAEDAALREALEETGVVGLALHPEAPRPFDVDVHAIPARPDAPAHDHLDLRYLVVAPARSRLDPQMEEVTDLRWFHWDELATLQLDQGLRRAFDKALAFLG